MSKMSNMVVFGHGLTERSHLVCFYPKKLDPSGMKRSGEGCVWKKAALKFWNPYSPNMVSERTDEHITRNSKEKSRSFIGFFFENVTEKQAIGP